MLGPAQPNLLAHAGVCVHCESDCHALLLIGSDSRTRRIQLVVNGKAVEIADPANRNRCMQFPDKLRRLTASTGYRTPPASFSVIGTFIRRSIDC
jgi:hypothetical protein